MSFFWIHNASEKIHRFVQHNPNNLNSLPTTQKKILRLTLLNRNNVKKLILTDSKNIFLLNISNQYNACNLILWLMVQGILW